MKKTRPFDHKVAELMCSNLLKWAAQQKEAAGYNGSFHDGGASVVEEKVQAFKAGMELRIPEFWSAQYAETYDRYLKVQDPEWQNYQRLKAKFEES